MNEFFEGLVEVKVSHIAKRLGYKSSVEKVHTIVFRATDIGVYWEHLVDKFAIERLVGVLVVGITEIVPTRANEGVESVGISSCVFATARTLNVHKLFALCKRGLSVGDFPSGVKLTL